MSRIKIDPRLAAFLLFVGFFLLYLRSSAPHVAPYRDAGEMACLLGTLGVAHPPGYPFYTLLGRWAMWIPLGNIIFRANLFSALCAAFSIALLFLMLREWVGGTAAFFSSAVFGLSNPFWELASVSEMYTLGILMLILLLHAVFVLKNPYLFAFLAGLALGVRMDLLLLLPIFGFWIIKNGPKPSLPKALLFFGLGASVFLYLTVRSLQDPLIDWGNPDSLEAVLRSVTRRSYSGTLDVLSLSYKKGENFLANLKLYGTHLGRFVGWIPLVISVFGWVFLLRRRKSLGFFLLALFLIAGPFFFFLANMPPNPHAVAIVEASYLVPDLMVAIAFGFGVACFFEKRFLKIPATIVLLSAAGVNACFGFERANKRHHWYARDYVNNVLRSVPRHAITVFQKDVQLFSLWAAQILEKRRLDVSLISKGLSGSPWYWDMMARWAASKSPPISLKSSEGWNQLLLEKGPRPLSIGFETDFGFAKETKLEGRGVVLIWAEQEGKTPDDRFLRDLCLYRGRYEYEEAPDFFVSDLITDHARAYHREGLDALFKGFPESAAWFFKRAQGLDPTFARVWIDHGYILLSKEDYGRALETYAAGIRKYNELLRRAKSYKALPDVVAGLNADLSNAHAQFGTAAEKLKQIPLARESYQKAFTISSNAQAHYNMGVTYWGENWDKVIEHMQAAVALNPAMTEAKTYLAIAHQKRLQVQKRL